MTSKPYKIFADALLAAGWKQLGPDDEWREDRGHQAVYPQGLSRTFIRGMSDIRELAPPPVRFFEAPAPVVEPVPGMVAWVRWPGASEKSEAFCQYDCSGNLYWAFRELGYWGAEKFDPITEDDVIYRPEVGE